MREDYLILELTPEQAQALLDFLIETTDSKPDEVLDIQDELEYLVNDISPVKFGD